MTSIRNWNITVLDLFQLNVTFIEVKIIHTYKCSHAYLSINTYISQTIYHERRKTCGHLKTFNEYIGSNRVYIYVTQFFSVRRLVIRFRYQVLSKSNELTNILEGYTIEIKPNENISHIPFNKYRLQVDGKFYADFTRWRIISNFGFTTAFTEVSVPCKFGTFMIFDGPTDDDEPMHILNCTNVKNTEEIYTHYFINTVVFSPVFQEGGIFLIKYRSRKLTDVSITFSR